MIVRQRGHDFQGGLGGGHAVKLGPADGQRARFGGGRSDPAGRLDERGGLQSAAAARDDVALRFHAEEHHDKYELKTGQVRFK